MKKILSKAIICILVIMLFTSSIIPINSSMASTEVIPNDNQYLELKATTIIEEERQAKTINYGVMGP